MRKIYTNHYICFHQPRNMSDQNINIPEVSVDCVIFGFHATDLKVLLLKVDDSEYWSLPMGSVSRKESLGMAASRVLEETTGIGNVFLQQFQTFGAVDRYKYYSKEQTKAVLESSKKEATESLSYQSTISIGYYALVDFEKIAPPFKEYQWCAISEIPNLLFDHNDFVDMALVALRKDLRYLPIAKLLPEKFTLREMQKLYETILDREFDRRNFHKLLMRYEFLIKLPEKRKGGANKPPNLYKIDIDKYETALQDGISY